MIFFYLAVASVRQAVNLITFIHEQVKTGMSVNAALNLTDKDRKTVDRFQHIYYLHHLNSDRLKQVVVILKLLQTDSLWPTGKFF